MKNLEAEVTKELDKVSEICSSIRREICKSPMDESVEEALFNILQALRMIAAAQARINKILPAEFK